MNNHFRLGAVGAACLMALSACGSGGSQISQENLFTSLAEGGIACGSEILTPTRTNGAQEATCDSEQYGRFTVILFTSQDAMKADVSGTVCEAPGADLTSFGANYFVLFYPPRETLDAVSRALGGQTGTAGDFCASL